MQPINLNEECNAKIYNIILADLRGQFKSQPLCSKNKDCNLKYFFKNPQK